MSRLSFRPRPVDIHRRLPIVKSSDFDDDDAPSSTRNSQFLRITASEADNEVHIISSRKVAPEIPTPQFVVVDTYERDYAATFSQASSYLRARGARAEIGEFVEYDLDNDDEDCLQGLHTQWKGLSEEMFEMLLFKLEVLDHKTRERAGIILPNFGSPIPVLLQFDAAMEALHAQDCFIQHAVFQVVYSYWKEKRQRWQKPILRRLQPPPPVNDTNPYNVFRPREKAHRLHTRRMQRRENNLQSFEKLRLVRRNFEQTKMVFAALVKREEKKKEVMESEVNLQNSQLKYKNEIELLLDEDEGFPGFPHLSSKYGSSEDELVDSDEFASSQPQCHRIPPVLKTHMGANFFRGAPIPPGRKRIGHRQQRSSCGWLSKLDPVDPVMLFTKPLVEEKLAAADIAPPVPSAGMHVALASSDNRFHGRIGRGGRIIFDRWNPFFLLCNTS